MARVKRGTIAKKRRKNVLQHTKGFRWGRKSKYRLAKEALIHAWQYAYRDRKTKKRAFRQEHEQTINMASRQEGIPYSRLIKKLKDSNVELDRKILAQLAAEQPEVFKKVLSQVK